MVLKHYLQFTDLDAGEYAYLFERAALIKRKFKAYEKHHTLADRTLAMIFERLRPAPGSALRPACTSWADRWCT
mgnify:CR=1 FL=1